MTSLLCTAKTASTAALRSRAEGEGLVLYHGSVMHLPSLRPSSYGAQGPGIYMTDRPNEYGTVQHELQVTLANPFWFHPSEEAFDAEACGELIESVLPPDQARAVLDRIDLQGVEAFGPEVQDALRRRGHDGIVIVCPWGEPVLQGASGECVVIAFDSHQVKVLRSWDREPQRPRECCR